jgi:hypothetical protein
VLLIRYEWWVDNMVTVVNGQERQHMDNSNRTRLEELMQGRITY